MKTAMLLLCLLLATGVAGAAESTHDHTIKSSHLEQPRSVTVHLPSSYDSHPQALYPVLYMLDRETNLDYTVAVADFLAGNGLVPELIIVAMHTGTTRAEDYVPGDDPTKGGDAYLAYLADDLVPFIESNYRAAPLRLLSGHSLGGLFVTHAMIERPGLFRAYMAMSPYLNKVNGTPLLDHMQAALEKGTLSGFYYCMLGDESDLESNFSRMDTILTSAAPESLTWILNHDTERTHMTTRLVGQYESLEKFFAEAWPLSTDDLMEGGYERLASHIEGLSRQYGYPVLYSEQVFRQTAQIVMTKGDMDATNQTAALYASQYPRSPVAHFLLAATWARTGQKDKAKAAIATALELYEADPAPDLAFLYGSMKVLRDSLNEN